MWHVRLKQIDKLCESRAVVVVKWSACLPSTLTIRVRIPPKPTVFSVKLCLKKTKINKKTGRGLKNCESTHCLTDNYCNF